MIDAFDLWCWKRLLRVPWTASRSNQSILKEISTDYSLEGLMLKLQLQYFGHLMQRTDSLEKTLMLGKAEAVGGRGWDDWWYHQLNGHGSEQAPGAGDGHRGLECCSPWGSRVGHDWVTELSGVFHLHLSFSIKQHLADRWFYTASFWTIIFVFPTEFFSGIPSSPEVNRVEEIRDSHTSHFCSSSSGSLYPKASSTSSCLSHHSYLSQHVPRKVKTVPELFPFGREVIFTNFL